MRAEYYLVRGWDEEGIPGGEKLKELKLKKL
jgi:aldehyde:ferredoxin oxidoreductase